MADDSSFALHAVIKRSSAIVHKITANVEPQNLSSLISHVAKMKDQINEKLTEMVNESMTSENNGAKVSQTCDSDVSSEDDESESEEPDENDDSYPQIRVKSMDGTPSEEDLNESVVNLKKRLDMLKSIVQEDKPLTVNHTMIDDNFLSILFAVALASIIGVTLYAFQGLYAAVTRKWDNKT